MKPQQLEEGCSSPVSREESWELDCSLTGLGRYLKVKEFSYGNVSPSGFRRAPGFE